MGFLDRVKLNYNLKILEDYINNNNPIEFKKKLVSISNQNPEIVFNILKILNKYLPTLSDENYYDQKIIWTISFDQNETKYINDFLNFYLNHINFINYDQGQYAEEVTEAISNFSNNIDLKFNFDDIVNDSNIYQNLIFLNSKKDFIFLDTCGAFFESANTVNKRYFIYPSFTQCFFYIVRNPLMLFSRYKDKMGSKEAAINEIITADYSIKETSTKNITFLENKQSWAINLKSWSTYNVISSYRGKLIKYEDIINDTENTLVEIIYHLKQSGMNIDINFEIIADFVAKNPIFQNSFEEPSNQEKKLLSRNIDKGLLDELEYKF